MSGGGKARFVREASDNEKRRVGRAVPAGRGKRIISYGSILDSIPAAL